MLKRLPATTKRNLLLELGNTQGDVGSRSPTLSPTRGYDVGGGGGIGRASGGTMPFRSDQIGPGRRATAPSFAPISVDDEPATRRHSTAPNFASTIAEDEQAVEQQVGHAARAGLTSGEGRGKRVGIFVNLSFGLRGLWNMLIFLRSTTALAAVNECVVCCVVGCLAPDDNDLEEHHAW